MSDDYRNQEKSDDRVMTIEIDCATCKAAIRSPIRFDWKDSFDTSTLLGNRLYCPSCGKMTACDKGNMRVVFVDDAGDISGGHVGSDVPPRDGAHEA